jgi:hypothetical protein
VTRNLLAQHPNAKFDKASGRLTLPPLSPGVFASASSPAEVGELIAAQTGVSKVTLHKTDEHIELVAHINPSGKTVTYPSGETKYVMIDPADGKRKLRPDYRGAQGVRKKMYDFAHDYSTPLRNHRDAVAAARTVKTGPNAGTHWIGDPSRPQREVPLTGNTRPTIEHDPAVVTHWNDTGHDTDQPTRIKFKNFTGNETSAKVLDAETNKSGGKYQDEVGSNFKGPDGK